MTDTRPPVPRVSLCPNGLQLSRIVAGAWRMDAWGWTPQQRQRWIEQNLEVGVSSFDHADIYGGYTVEALFGEALALAPSLRARLQLVSKCGIQLVSAARPEHRLKAYDTSYDHIVASAEHSLRALRTDHLDLLLLHRPDPLMDADEVARAFDHLRQAGKVLHFGVSNFTPAQFSLLASRTALSTNQVECSPLQLQALHDGTLDQAQQLRLKPMIWSPLAGGRLFTGDDERSRRVRACLERIAARYGCSPASVAYAWLLRHPALPLPIVGSRRIEAVQEAVAALSVPLDAPTWHEIWSASTGHEVP
ncbi:aldo/keto reductase [Caldimonas brevitalea]|uniref:Oxidoreductase n=1 Tax=Caldimonas brevitalea TaxID=413882 RepID=A0A0G3BT65_9BURK|nr:aldo/keto reductase [Caldimonas brevitalea]AKJ31203.1 oxidoreductase [Caldimonas brevitalea]